MGGFLFKFCDLRVCLVSRLLGALKLALRCVEPILRLRKFGLADLSSDVVSPNLISSF